MTPLVPPPLPRPAGRAPGASAAELHIGELQSTSLQLELDPLLLRRTNEDLASNLPDKHAYVLSVRPTEVQRKVHQAITTNNALSAFSTLHMIYANLLQPEMLLNSSEKGGSREGGIAFRRVVEETPYGVGRRMALSGKLQLCARLLDALLPTGERVVVVCSSVYALTLVGEYVRAKDEFNDAVCTLIGSMTQRRRDAVRHEFNSPTSSLRVCLLSTKLAEGLNLVGANHLVQLDASWNPSTVGRRASIPRASVVPRLDLTLTRRASFRCNATRSHKFALLLLVVARPRAHTLETVARSAAKPSGASTVQGSDGRATSTG